MILTKKPSPTADFATNFVNRIYQNDCLRVLPLIPDASVNLILTDPPYRDYQSNRPVARPKVKKVSVNTFDMAEFIHQSTRLLKPDGHFYCWCDHRTFPELVDAIELNNIELTPEEKLRYKNCLVWVKNNHGSGDLKGDWAPQHEFILFAVKGKGAPLRGKRQPNVFFQRDASGSIRFYQRTFNYRHNHGTTKPQEILTRLIEASSDPGDLVLDPYAGTLSTAVAARRLQRNYLMIELEKEHLRNNIKRLSEPVAV
ncbi:site-specific DNA-methyltransferase [bacterium]|nr:site-specific DNA-methyltransferase [bacterium]